MAIEGARLGSFPIIADKTRQSVSDPIVNIKGNSHHQRMRLLVFLSITALMACTQTESRFVVGDQQKSGETATLMLCGSETPLQRPGDQLAVSKVVQCEGDGHIERQYSSDDGLECVVGYMMPGAVQNFTFRATDNGCA